MGGQEKNVRKREYVAIVVKIKEPALEIAKGKCLAIRGGLYQGSRGLLARRGRKQRKKLKESWRASYYKEKASGLLLEKRDS